MPYFKKEHITIDGAEKKELSFTIDVHVNAEGEFTTNLPVSIVELFTAANIQLKTNGKRNGRPGFFWNITFEGLINEVKEACAEYVSCELIHSSIVLQYGIETLCCYQKDEAGELFPNGCFHSDKIWRTGTKDVNGTYPSPYGIQVYVYPFKKKIYKYKSGKTKIEYTRLSLSLQDTKEYDFNLIWLSNLTCIAPVGNIQEVTYNKNIGAFFVNMVKALINLNEKIKDFLSPEAIELMANNNGRLIS